MNHRIISRQVCCFSGLVGHSGPYRVNHRGRRLDLTGRQAELLYKLIMGGRASFIDLMGDTSVKAVQTKIYELRRALPAGFAIRSVHGWGYELAMEQAGAALPRYCDAP